MNALRISVLICFFAIGDTQTFQQNFDARVKEFTEKYLPLKHRPKISESTVYVFADLYNIIDLNAQAETITTKLWNYVAYIVDVDWDAWDNLTDYYMYEFYPGKNKIWLPDIIVLNNVEVIETTFDSPVVQRFFYCFTPTFCPTTGAIVIYPFAQTQLTTCSFDVTSFPFDTQKCTIEIGPWFTDFTQFPRDDSWDYGPYKIRHPDDNMREMTLEAYQTNSQWDLVSTSLEYETRSAVHDVAKQFDVMVYTLTLSRKPAFFVYTLVVPCLMLTLLVVLSIYLPVDSGEKMGLGMTIMLTQVVNLFILSGLIPTSSQHFPRLGYYFLVTIGLIALSLLYNVININMYYYSYSEIFQVFFRRQNDQNDENSGIMKEPKSTEEAIGLLSQLVGELDEQPDNGEERRRNRCIVLDHIFGTIMLAVILITTGIFFLPEA